VTRERVRIAIGLALTLALVGPLAWMWWGSRLPSSYSAMEMGELDYGGGPSTGHAGHLAHGGDATTSVADLDTDPDRRAAVVVELTARQGTVRLPSGRKVEGYTLNGTSPGPTITATVGQLVEVRLHNESVEGGVVLHWHGADGTTCTSRER
jgi:FtsP/CotA-like multicopper oxidase with cupredoxin domain